VITCGGADSVSDTDLLWKNLLIVACFEAALDGADAKEPPRIGEMDAIPKGE